VDRDRLPAVDVSKLGLFEIGFDPEISGLDNGEHPLGELHSLACIYGSLRDYPRNRRADGGAAQL